MTLLYLGVPSITIKKSHYDVARLNGRAVINLSYEILFCHHISFTSIYCDGGNFLFFDDILFSGHIESIRCFFFFFFKFIFLSRSAVISPNRSILFTIYNYIFIDHNYVGKMLINICHILNLIGPLV